VITVDFKRLRIKPGFRILDIGCGTGRHACEAFSFEKVFVVGSDRSFPDIREARNRLIFHERVGAHGNGSWATPVADIARLPFRDEVFDLVICSEVLEHVSEPDQTARELVRVLKPGRNLAVSVPRYLPERICWALSDDYHMADGGHVRIYRKNQLIALMENAGVRKRAAHFAHSLHTFFWWLKCIVGPMRKDSAMINLYHRFLVWDMMKHPRATRFIESLMNPLLGKSLVVYFQKE
jgi:2-polyprenyl-3-methyl-5-hydroxy-6-metoxy-1,4-benzoquinol methylase